MRRARAGRQAVPDLVGALTALKLLSLQSMCRPAPPRPAPPRCAPPICCAHMSVRRRGHVASEARRSSRPSLRP